MLILVIPILIFLFSISFINSFIELLQSIIKDEDYTKTRVKCIILFSLMMTLLSIYNLYLKIIYI